MAAIKRENLLQLSGDGQLVFRLHILRRVGGGGRPLLHSFDHVPVRHLRGPLYRRDSTTQLLLDCNGQTLHRPLPDCLDLLLVHQHRPAAGLEGEERLLDNIR